MAEFDVMDIPANVRRAVIIWAVAVAAGVFESVLAVIQAVHAGALGSGVWVGIAVRLVVYTLATALITNFRKGRRWARAALTVLLSIIGLASLIVPAAIAMVNGQTFVRAFSDGGTWGWIFLAVRLTHIACVVSATALMFTRSANRYFAAVRRSHPSASASR
ncbi:glucan phosphoethanolaminetransferase (alkaline phosphatase superfamily) [Actinopolyspora biskrensis]|uniref:Glucan phosphoethanolaminetransferase (Alkaline phosphatase superfamily) n=1 Tax=Actinopolyspora biskrensis TaxID=1470178 RepID=A0A852YU58_9ACTN|nr:hypothetical protein [Actinopolyspora biskrensis]NYH77610.1 glucan phosphoethanolaminetransferase (alkaline phosphatase superfamily) [Actinopolyspora biskrensis]